MTTPTTPASPATSRASADALTRRVVSTRAEEQTHLDALNRCYAHWGDRAAFEWCFTRESAGLRPDLFWLCGHDGRPLAGTANTYRRVALANGRSTIVAIMTGSWTLPEARGRGAFTRIIHESRELAAARQAALLLGFGRAANVSIGRLRETGSAMRPTFYCRSPSNWHRHDAETSWVDSPVEQIDRASFDSPAAAVRFVYDDEDWRAQFVRRPTGVTAYVSSQGTGRERWRAIVERGPTFDRVHALAITPATNLDDASAWTRAIVTLAARAASADRRLFCFTTEASHAAALTAVGFDVVEGMHTIAIANDATLRSALALDVDVPSLSGGDSRAVIDPASPWFLGRWLVHGGDRM